MKNTYLQLRNLIGQTVTAMVQIYMYITAQNPVATIIAPSSMSNRATATKTPTMVAVLLELDESVLRMTVEPVHNKNIVAGNYTQEGMGLVWYMYS